MSGRVHACMLVPMGCVGVLALLKNSEQGYRLNKYRPILRAENDFPAPTPHYHINWNSIITGTTTVHLRQYLTKGP